SQKLTYTSYTNDFGIQSVNHSSITSILNSYNGSLSRLNSSNARTDCLGIVNVLKSILIALNKTYSSNCLSLKNTSLISTFSEIPALNSALNGTITIRLNRPFDLSNDFGIPFVDCIIVGVRTS